jgi:Short-chain dehydrogenases of various substrate specificities
LKDFSQKVALISGAGSGIGRALSIELADMGCNLALLDRNKESLEETKQL